jgi:hypothetical protein
VYDFIKEKQVETVTPEAAASLVSSGDWVLVDVRRPDQFATGSPRGSVNVPMYRKIDLSGGFDGMKVRGEEAAAGLWRVPCCAALRCAALSSGDRRGQEKGSNSELCSRGG